MPIEIDDRCYRKSTLEVIITTPKDGMEYDADVVRRSAKHLVEAMSENTSTGFTHALEEALRERHNSICGMAVV